MYGSTALASQRQARSKPQEAPSLVAESYETRAAVATRAAARVAAEPVESGSAAPAGLKRPAAARNSVRPTAEFRELMEEPPGGPNAGRAATTDPNELGRTLPLGTDAAQAHDFVRGGGWTIVDTTRGSHAGGAREAGMRAHRGVLRGDEHVDEEVLRAAVEAELGFSFDDVRAVYRQGRLSTEQGELRALIDARLLALSRAGANMLALGRVLGFTSTDGTWPRPIKNALARAKAAELPTEGRA